MLIGNRFDAVLMRIGSFDSLIPNHLGCDPSHILAITVGTALTDER